MTQDLEQARRIAGDLMGNVLQAVAEVVRARDDESFDCAVWSALSAMTSALDEVLGGRSAEEWPSWLASVEAGRGDWRTGSGRHYSETRAITLRAGEAMQRLMNEPERAVRLDALAEAEERDEAAFLAAERHASSPSPETAQ